MDYIVTIDLDFPSRMEILKIFLNLSYMCDDVDFRRSVSKGLHLRGRIKGDFYDSMEMRLIIGDDSHRITMDSHRKQDENFDTDVLWDLKNGRSAGEWYHSFDDLELILQSMEMEIMGCIDYMGGR